MTRLIGVYGASGCGRGILPLLRAQYPKDRLVFIDDTLCGQTINGHRVLNWAAFLQQEAGEKAVSIAVAAPKRRQRLAEKAATANISLIEARAGSVVQMDAVEIGVGACLSPFVSLTSNIRIGRCFHANLYAYVEHDCHLGDYVTLAPAAKVNGNISIGDHAYIGAGAVLRQGIAIGAGAIIGMGAVVTRDVPAGETVAGNPAKPLIKM